MPGPDGPVLLVLGYANADVLARVSRLPGDGDRITASEIATYPGGMAANCACAASLLGSRVRFLGNLGRDAFGEMLLRDFGRYGVDSAYATRVERTTTAIVTVTPRGERTIISEPTTYQAEGIRAALQKDGGASGFLYVDGYHLGWAREEIRLAKSKGCTIYCDLDGAPDTYGTNEILELLAQVDIVQWNPKVASALFPERDTQGADRELAKRVTTVLSTRGGEDLHLWRDGRRRIVPVPQPGGVVDTTGAGDIFAGAFLHYHSSGPEIEESAAKAVEVAADSTLYPGARLPLPLGSRSATEGTTG